MENEILAVGCGVHESDWKTSCRGCWNALKENSDSLIALITGYHASQNPEKSNRDGK